MRTAVRASFVNRGLRGSLGEGLSTKGTRRQDLASPALSAAPLQTQERAERGVREGVGAAETWAQPPASARSASWSPSLARSLARLLRVSAPAELFPMALQCLPDLTVTSVGLW